MKSIAWVKAIPLLIVSIYAAAKSLPAGRAKHMQKPATSPQSPHVVQGSVQKVLKDHEFTYIQIERAGDRWWVAAKCDAPEIGEQVTCDIVRSLDAFESKGLTIAFERLYFTDEFKRSRRAGDAV